MISHGNFPPIPILESIIDYSKPLHSTKYFQSLLVTSHTIRNVTLTWFKREQPKVKEHIFNIILNAIKKICYCKFYCGICYIEILSETKAAITYVFAPSRLEGRADADIKEIDKIIYDIDHSKNKAMDFQKALFDITCIIAQKPDLILAFWPCDDIDTKEFKPFQSTIGITYIEKIGKIYSDNNYDPQGLRVFEKLMENLNKKRKT